MHFIIREYDSTLYLGMVQGVSNSQYIGIGTKLLKRGFVGLNTKYSYTNLTWKASERGLSARK